MTKDGIINPSLCEAIAGCGHTDYFVIADAGLPLPCGVRVIDLSLIRGVPTFIDTINAIKKQLVIESFVLAEEMEPKSKALFDETCAELSPLPYSIVSHEQLKEMTKKAKVIIRTGEATPYANVILVCGVNF